MSIRTIFIVVLLVLVCGMGMMGCSTVQDTPELVKTIEEGGIEKSPISPLSLRGIAYNPRGRSIALIGESHYSVGDEIDAWIVSDIQMSGVILENAEGETMELKMKDR